MNERRHPASLMLGFRAYGLIRSMSRTSAAIALHFRSLLSRAVFADDHCRWVDDGLLARHATRAPSNGSRWIGFVK